MGLREAAAATAVIKTSGGGEFAVRGLDSEDIGFLVREHKAVGVALYERFAVLRQQIAVVTRRLADAGETNADPAMDGFDETTKAGLNELLDHALTMAPKLVVQIVALAVDEDMDLAERMKLVRRIGVSAQIKALREILRVTFETEGGPKKVIETVVGLVADVTGLLQALNDQENLEE